MATVPALSSYADHRDVIGLPRQGISIALKSTADSGAPSVVLVSPSTGVALGAATPIVVEVSDLHLLRCILTMSFQGSDGDSEVVFDGASFSTSYASSESAPISNGQRFTIRRAGGWTAGPTLRAYAVDAFGNEA